MLWAENSNLEQNTLSLLFADDRKIFAQDEEDMRYTIVKLLRGKKRGCL
jgi:hypothetical protein